MFRYCNSAPPRCDNPVFEFLRSSRLTKHARLGAKGAFRARFSGWAHGIPLRYHGTRKRDRFNPVRHDEKTGQVRFRSCPVALATPVQGAQVYEPQMARISLMRTPVTSLHPCHQCNPWFTLFPICLRHSGFVILTFTRSHFHTVIRVSLIIGISPLAIRTPPLAHFPPVPFNPHIPEHPPCYPS
jgi:hypothetical protein